MGVFDSLIDCLSNCEGLYPAGSGRVRCYEVCLDKAERLLRLGVEDGSVRPDEAVILRELIGDCRFNVGKVEALKDYCIRKFGELREVLSKVSDLSKFENCFPQGILELREFMAKYRRIGRSGFEDWQIVAETSSVVSKMLEEGKRNKCPDLENTIIMVVSNSLDRLGIDRYSITRAYKHGMTEEVRGIILEIFPNIEWIREPTPIQVIESSQPRQEEIVVKPSRAPSQYDLPPIETPPQQSPQQPKPSPPSPPPQQQPQTPKEPQNYPMKNPSVGYDYEHSIVIDALIEFFIVSLFTVVPAAYVYSRIYPVAVQESSAELVILASLILIGAIIFANNFVKEYNRWKRYATVEELSMVHLILDVIAIIAVLIVYVNLLITVINMNQIGALIVVIFLGFIIFGGYILAREYAKYRLVKLLGPPR